MTPPARGDHEARRRDVSEAVWRVLADRGFGGLTLRAVAAELGASTGLLTHYFPHKRALVAHALEVLDRQAAERRRPATEAAATSRGLPVLRAALLDVLPLDADGEAGNRIWVGSWDAALGDPELTAGHAERYRRARRRMTELCAQAQELGDLPADRPAADLAALAQSFALGLVVQALFAPGEFPPARQRALLDDFLAGLAAGER
ncbi:MULTISPECIES: TetR/AcrR family transcriptional regulator [Kitasatospora]|uniref:Putative TetR family transcriptional regulator n=1 Tax=Kitasatospora setae (strain ATCC 33774 / DSM 43861 / JCM 3304 / KCC A-0304 / NBRC 14216 / KM-6054) TaxID=452652 RepID=E4NIA1_KITSK|nr:MULTISPECIES: TetR/AcrR family transcriptional regulator [Kitasatospora]BAJ31231.1 putative TetR family transcriptional regulator [Kitasatospora setae KM-6054]